MNKNHKDQQSPSTATGQKQNDVNRNQTNGGTKHNSKSDDDRQISPKGNSDKTGKAGMDHENKNHDSDRNKNSKY